MVKMINAATGTEMWVAENRLEEYKAAGHKLAADDFPMNPPETPEVEAEEPEALDVEAEEKPKKRTRKVR